MRDDGPIEAMRLTLTAEATRRFGAERAAALARDIDALAASPRAGRRGRGARGHRARVLPRRGRPPNDGALRAVRRRRGGRHSRRPALGHRTSSRRASPASTPARTRSRPGSRWTVRGPSRPRAASTPTRARVASTALSTACRWGSRTSSTRAGLKTTAGARGFADTMPARGRAVRGTSAGGRRRDPGEAPDDGVRVQRPRGDAEPLARVPDAGRLVRRARPPRWRPAWSPRRSDPRPSAPCCGPRPSAASSA